MLLLRWIFAMVMRGRGAVSLLVVVLFSLWLARFEPLQRERIRRGLLTTVLLPLHSVVTAFKIRTDMAGTITRLEQENTRLQVRNAILRDMSAENERLRQMLRLAPRVSYPLLAAEILARQSVRPMGSWVVDRGHEAGVEEGMAVLGPEGVIGRVIESGRQRYIEGATFSVEILFQLPFDTFERLVDALPIAFGSARFVAARKADHLECVATPGQ